VSLLTLWLSHSVVALPYVIRTTLAVLAESDPFLEEAARTMGAGRLQRLWFVVVPQCVPGLGAGAFFAFNISFDEAVLSLFLRKPDLTTLPVQIYGQLEFSPDPSVAAVSAIMIFLTVLMIVVIDRILGLQRFARS
jgi:putative spermidine/putrescine transport system permease protein